MLHSVRTAVPGFGAAGRIVATPDGPVTVELPAGQSGHPLSPHYGDRHARWAGRGASRSHAGGCHHVLRPRETADVLGCEGDESR
jgi:penicillin G amidase